MDVDLSVLVTFSAYVWLSLSGTSVCLESIVMFLPCFVFQQCYGGSVGKML